VRTQAVVAVVVVSIAQHQHLLVVQQAVLVSL
jgi:hypothetical protein